MLDFLKISTRSPKRDIVEIYPKFIIKKSNDLMIRGGDFYAIWIEELGLWSNDEQDALQLIDMEIDKFYKEYSSKHEGIIKPLYMWDADTGLIDKWHKYCQKQQRDSYHNLDEKLIFSNMDTTKKDYASKKLNYPLESGNISSYNELMSVLYSEEERHKIEWAIGSIVTGDSKKIQKFMVLYGSAGTGKSTILNIIQQLFDGYYSVFDAKALGSSTSVFALEAFKSNPLVAIQHDGDLSRIEDNTRLNSLVSHEYMTINEKFKSTYTNQFKCFLFMGTNKPVKITDAKSGLIRRLIDVSPTGNKLKSQDYKRIMKQISFELGAIANHCKEVYLSDPGKYDDYIPINMLGASNDFYNFVMDSYLTFKNEDSVTLKSAWEMYKVYCDDANVTYPFSKRIFKEELKNYFYEYLDRYTLEDGTRVRNYFKGFKYYKFDEEYNQGESKEEKTDNYIVFKEQESIFDKEYFNCLAQYANDKETPSKKWEKVTTKLSDIDTHKLHYVKIPENHIVIDFDIPDENGNKCFEKNLKEASKWPATYSELSKSGAGIHLHYIYTGDVTKLSRIYDDNIEIKIFNGKSSLRRKLTKCNDLPIASINSGLPLKGEKKMVNFETIKSENRLRTLIKRNLMKEIHPGTKPSVDFIYKILEDAYSSGLRYDITDMRNTILAFAAGSTHQSDYCIKLVGKMHFKSEENPEPIDNEDAKLIFYDVEVFPNLFLVNWKMQGIDKQVVRMINPTPTDIEELIKFKLVGFNCRRYDNHILYARMLGYTNEQLYNLSQKIITAQKGDKNSGLFGGAYNISYTDIYDFASAGNKKSLKKLEIEMGNISEDKLKKKGFSEEEIKIIKAGTHHKELGLPWDQPVPEEQWIKVAEYCDNDVLATEAAFIYLKGDWTARQILADISGMTVNDTTNTLSTRIIFGNNKNPQSEFNYRDLSKPVGSDQYEEYRRKFGDDYKFRIFDDNGLPLYMDYNPDIELPKGYSILPFFKGYKFEFGKSTYMNEEIGEGGKVYAEPGMYGDVWDADVTGQHPSTIIIEVLFGPKYTKAFKEIVDGRVSIKHESWDTIDKLFNGKLKPYIQKVLDGKLTVKDLANALKTVVNSVYGLTSASFDNSFRDKRNIDNIVAKRGSLFMTLLKSEVQRLGYKVAHIKTDSIKIPDATPEIKDFVIKFGKEFGYSFETEAEFEKFCLVNDAVYIAKTKDGEWTATGAQFAVPYVFKKLFSKEEIVFEDLCETKSVAKGVLYLDMNEGLPDVSEWENLKELRSKNPYKLTKKAAGIIEMYKDISDEELDALIAEGHNYIFVGKVGQFCPIKSGCGGGVLYRMNNNKYYAAAGTKGYRWLESEMVKDLGREKDIDKSYYEKLTNEAIDVISGYGDYEWFVSDDTYIGPIRKKPIDNEPCMHNGILDIACDELPF